MRTFGGVMKLRLKRKKIEMKTQSILITISAVALAAITTSALADNGALLSPRAAGNQIIHTAGTSGDSDLVMLRQTSPEYAAPRLAGNVVVKVTGTDSAVNPSTLCSRNMTASPKMIQACAANPSAPMPCCNVAANKTESAD
jgi:hypothetical protein